MKNLTTSRFLGLTTLTVSALCLSSLTFGQTSSDTAGSSPASGSSSSTGASDSVKTGSAPSDTSADAPSSNGYSNKRRSGETASSATTLSSGDRKFLEKAAQDNAQEIAVARLAAAQATDPAVKSYAQQLLTDHEAAATKIASVAAIVGFTPAHETKESHHAMSLSKKSGADFDKEFVDMMVSDHKDTASLFEKAAKKSDNPGVAAFARELLPKFQQHEKMAMELKSSLKK